MFDYREFLMQGFKSAVGKMADYKVIFNANGYYEKGVLTEEDLAELQGLIDEKNAPAVVPEIIEELPEETDTEETAELPEDTDTEETAENTEGGE